MKKEEVTINLEKLRLAFFASPTRGLIFYENLLLPEDDKGMNEEGFKNIREAFQATNSDQKTLADEVISILKELRQEALSNKENRELIQKYRDAVLDDVALYRVVAESDQATK